MTTPIFGILSLKVEHPWIHSTSVLRNRARPRNGALNVTVASN